MSGGRWNVRPLREALGETLKQARVQAGLTHSDAAAALSTSPTTIYRWEDGTRTPHVSDLYRAAAAYGTTADALLPKGDFDANLQVQGRAQADARKARGD